MKNLYVYGDEEYYEIINKVYDLIIMSYDLEDKCFINELQKLETLLTNHDFKLFGQKGESDG